MDFEKWGKLPKDPEIRQSGISGIASLEKRLLKKQQNQIIVDRCTGSSAG
jgi:hypothetical protein